jgi:two-component system, response regulator RegA
LGGIAVTEDLSFKPDELPQDRSLILVDDDRAFVLRLAKAMEGRGFANARSIVLTGYGNIATAVTAVKLGAVDYLAKPADADDVTDALLAPHNEKAPPPENPMSADRVRWEHIQRVYELCNRNVSETARRLNMHRRTLQRILAKRAPK